MLNIYSVLGLILIGISVSFAQTPNLLGAKVLGQAASFKYYVWGSVRAPGVHLLGPETDITELLSAAGGPAPDANLSSVDIIHGVNNQVERVDLNNMIESGEMILLSPGDVVIIRRALWARLRQNMIIVSSMAAILNLAFTISRLSN